MKIKNVGEFGLIERIAGWITAGDSSVIVGIGDDAAVVQDRPGYYRLITSDAFVEGVHFKRDYASFWQIGWRTMAANLSDIAAMGGSPRWAVVCVALPEDVLVEEVKELYRGMDAVCSVFNCTIVGGDTTLSPDKIMISIALIGEVETERLILRRGAELGDSICVTGHLGGSQAGLEVLKGKGPTEQDVVKRHLTPTPRVREARTIGDVAKIHAMIDISDGLSSEVHHICRESKMGAKLFADRIPILSGASDIAVKQGKSPLDFALAGGEDFELLFILSPDDVDKVRAHLEDRTGTSMTVIGEIVESEKGVTILDEVNGEKMLPPSGYQHFLDQS